MNMYVGRRPHVCTWKGLCICKGTCVPLHAMKTYRGRGGTAPHILELDINTRLVVSLMPRPHYVQGMSPPIFTE
jgi:hypothetical protein